MNQSRKKGPIPYLGGKTRLAKQIISRIEKIPHQCYIEVFAGGAQVFFRKETSRSEVLNDINGDLINLYRVIQNHLEEFIRQFRWCLVSRDEFERQRQQRSDLLTDVQRAARFYYLQKLAFGGKLGGVYGISTTSPPRLNLLRIEEELSQVHLRLTRVNIERLSWQDCLRHYDRPNSFFYLDPPYWGSENDYGKEIFRQEEFTEMAAILSKLQADWLLSLNDTPEVRNVFSEFVMQQVVLKYSVGRSATSAKELLISPKKQPY